MWKQNRGNGWNKIPSSFSIFVQANKRMWSVYLISFLFLFYFQPSKYSIIRCDWSTIFVHDFCRQLYKNQCKNWKVSLLLNCKRYNNIERKWKWPHFSCLPANQNYAVVASTYKTRVVISGCHKTGWLILTLSCLQVLLIRSLYGSSILIMNICVYNFMFCIGQLICPSIW